MTLYYSKPEEETTFGGHQRTRGGHYFRSQGQELERNLRPKTDFLRTDPFKAKDRNGRGQAQGSRTQFF